MKRLLLVEDDPATRIGYAELLQARGFNVEAVGTAHAAGPGVHSSGSAHLLRGSDPAARGRFGGVVPVRGGPFGEIPRAARLLRWNGVIARGGPIP